VFVKQISVFLENTRGSLFELTRVLADGKVDLIALSIADTENYGILRCIVSDTEKAVQLLRDDGYTVKVTDVLAVAVPDAPGGLHKVLSCFDENGISVEYLYSFVRRVDGKAHVIVRADDREAAAKVLRAAGAEMIGEEQVRSL